MNKMKELRLETGRTQNQVAEMLGITQQAYANYERQSREADYKTLFKLSQIYNCTIDYLLGKSDLRNPLDIPEHIEGIANLVLRMRSDDEFSDIINKINELSPEQLKAISTILSSMN